MASVDRMISGLADYTLADLEALENERPCAPTWRCTDPRTRRPT